MGRVSAVRIANSDDEITVFQLRNAPLRLPDRGSARDALVHQRDERAVIICDRVIELIGALFDVPSREIRQTGRCVSEIAKARHIAIYVAHTRLRLSMREVAIGFNRDRTTVVYACHLVEDQRDDRDFDRLVALTERVVDAAFVEHF